MNMRAWLRYESDVPKKLFEPKDETWVPTYFRDEVERGEFATDGWTREEWRVRSALVAPSVATTAAARLWANDIEFGPPSWEGGHFDFGDRSTCRGITLYPWIHTYENPVSGRVEMRLREDFIRFHALVQSSDTEWRHPVDGTPVVRMELRDSFPCVEVYRNYLLDYLAAVNRRLLICAIAERFATRDSESSLGIEHAEDVQVARWARLTTTITAPVHPATPTSTGRGTLVRNQILEPSRGPAVSSSPWPNCGQSAGASPSAIFIVDDEGTDAPLDRVEPASYLFFKPNVLDRHFTQDHYGVFFHMRTWGRAWHPVGDIGVDVGINSEGLVVAFAGDLQELRPTDQNYWSGFSANPHGGDCEEMYLTRMLCSPPHSPGTVELLEGARAALDAAYESRFGSALFGEHDPADRVRMRISVGPIRNEVAELCALAKDLYVWLGDALRKQALSPNAGIGQQQMKELGTIRLLEKVLVHGGMPSSETQRLSAPLDALRELRLGDAHSQSDPGRKAQQRLGLTGVVGERVLWFTLIDALVSSFTEIAVSLRS